MIPISTKEYIQRKIFLATKPKILNIEPTNFCNLDCPLCVTKNDRKQGFLDLNLLKKFITQNIDILRGQFIWLHFSGEPLVHPRFLEIIKLLKKNGIKARFSTNATLLNKETSLKLMEAGLDYIVFSVDGVTKKTYEKIRRGANFETVEGNILNFLKIKKEKKFKTKTQIQIIKTKVNESEIKPFIKKWKETDINYINIKSFCSRAWKAKEIEMFTDISKLKEKIKNRPPCFYPWETLVILWNGDVLVCCQDLTGELKVGNIKDQTLMEIWNSRKLINLRKQHLMGDFSTAPCLRCPDWKSAPRNYFSYYSQSLLKYLLRVLVKREVKEEGINIIFNKK